MQALKIIVVVMGVLIILGTVIVIVTIAQRVSKGPARGFESTSLVLPKGCRVTEMAAAGAKVALRLGEGPDCQAILFVDPESGRQTGRIQLLAQP